MPRTPQISRELIDAAKEAACKASSVKELRAAQAVLLPGLFGLSLHEVSQVVGRSRATVTRLQTRFREVSTGGEIPGKKWGGRRRAYLTLEEEKELLDGFLKRASEGGVLEVGKIKTAYEQEVGHDVAKSTVYRVLERHGWRKVAPRRRHPKTNTEKQDAFKKNSRRLSRRK